MLTYKDQRISLVGNDVVRGRNSAHSPWVAVGQAFNTRWRGKSRSAVLIAFCAAPTVISL